ncbi:hypothetical protein AB0L80_38700 [Streptomyces sp. NPDC052069]|uniref:hypothetical protein n=1 Tax=Streptomyces sp. NPDC052069 TaxID=3154650 RepID=UPI00343B7042
MDDENVVFLRPRAGAGAPPGLPPLAAPPALPPPPTTPPATPPAAPAAPAPAPPEPAPVPVPDRARRSAADSLGDLTAPLPELSAAPPASVSVPATFRSDGLAAAEPGPPAGPPLGSMSLSAILAVALAALRGTVTFVSDWRQRRMDRLAEEAAWREARVQRRAAEEQARAKSIPSSSEYGSKAVQDGRKAAGGGGGGSLGPGKKQGPGSGSGTGPKEQRGKDPARPKEQSKSSGPGPKPSGRDPKPQPRKDPARPEKPRTPAPETPKRASSGVVGPGKSGGSGKGVLERVRDRRAKDPAGPEKPKDPKSKGPSGGSGKGPLERVRDRRAKGPAGPEKPKDPKSKDPKGKDPKGGSGHGPGGGAGRTEKPGRTPGRVRPVRKVPGAAHGTPEGYDTDKCRCLSCRRAARRRDAEGKAGKSGPAPKTPRGSTGPGSSRTGKSRKSRTGKRRTGKGRTGKGSKGGTGTVPPPRGSRRSSDEDLHNATAYTTATKPTYEWRPTREPAGAVTTGVRGLPRAPEAPAGPRPGTTAPARTASSTGTASSTSTTGTTKGTPVRSPVRMPGLSGADAEHMTEVTLDDVLDHLSASKVKCFKTYDECAELAAAARKLKRALDDLVDELAGRHNVRGRLTRAAASRLSEVMDVVARKAEEMRTKSLLASESVETAHDEMHDAYRPVQQAAADAGLAMPSARIHNED